MDNGKLQYNKLCEEEQTIPLFSQPWWLDAVCGPENWDVSLVEKGDKTAGSLPYFQIRKFGLTLLVMPALTRSLGPWVRYPDGQKMETRLSWEKKIYTELLDQLPDFDLFSQRFDPSVTNWLPFHWQRFRQTTRYTYQLDLSDRDQLWDNLRENIRREIRKAQKEVSVETVNSVDTFYEVNRKTFSRQDADTPYSLQFIQRLDEACRQRDCRKIFIARDGQQNIHAGIYIVWDANHTYYLMGGADPEYRSSGAASLLLWDAIQFAVEKTTVFDFEGSMLEPVERFFRAFGARQTPYYQVSRADSWLVRLYQAGNYLLCPNKTIY